MGRASWLAALFLLSCCGQVPGNVRIYFLEPEVGLIRKQAEETLPFAKARGYLCQARSDFEDTVGCVAGNAKVWAIDPDKGLVRKQQNEVRKFSNSRGYICVSKDGMKQILDKCV